MTVLHSHIFFGTKKLLTDVYGMKSDKQLVNTLEENIRRGGAVEDYKGECLKDSTKMKFVFSMKEY